MTEESMHTLSLSRMTLAAAVMLAVASPAFAQSRRNSTYGRDNIPPGQRPPAGMCRVWIDGVPPGRQPAPTDCATALATRPANARVIYGDRANSFPGKGKGKWKNAQRSAGDVDTRRTFPYGVVSPDQRGTMRRDDDDDDRFEGRKRDAQGEGQKKHKNKNKHDRGDD
jgi:hypothetical protein